jgi:hypothetical protein
MQPSSKDQRERVTRSYAPFVQSEIELIDGWADAQRIRNRAEAVRQLVFRGLAAEGIKRARPAARAGRA